MSLADALGETHARKMVDVTEKYERMKCEMMLMRVCLGLSPAHDLLRAVQILHDEGRDAMEKMRGPKSEHSHLCGMV